MKSNFFKILSNQEQSGKLRFVLDFLLTILGSAVIAFSFNLFFRPNQIAPGGISGLSVVFDYLYEIPPAITQWVLGGVFLVIGLIVLGKKFVVKTIIGTISVPLFVYISESIPVPTHNLMLAAIFGGVGVGLGVGIVFLGKSSSGGTDTLAQVIHKLTHFPQSKILSVIDGLILLIAVATFGIEKGLYAIIALFCLVKAIDVIQFGLTQSRSIMIITENPDYVRKEIIEKIDRGLTKVTAEGGYTGKSKSIIIVVVAQTEYINLRRVVLAVDPEAFMIVTNATEVHGTGFMKQT